MTIKITITEPGEYELTRVVSASPAVPWVPIGFPSRIFCPKGLTGPSGPTAAAVSPIAPMKRYRIAYDVMPEGAFDFRAGGKLPGLGGGSAPAGGSRATDGFTARLMWNLDGRLSFYFYRVLGGSGGIDTGGYGTHWRWAEDAKLIAGQWNAIELLCDTGTGETVGKLNGVEKARQTLRYQWSTIDKHVFSAFFGGQGAQYEPVKDEYLAFRDMKILPGG